MGNRSAASAAYTTLAGTTVLHAFTHIYATMFLPLYVLMSADLHLKGVRQAGLVATVYGIVYWALSFPAGVLADRYDRRLLLGFGLLGNALAVVGMSLVHRYDLVLVFAALGGVFGSLFHPCANALVPAHFPKSPGTAIGLLGIGSGLGFFFGPYYAGRSAQHSLWGAAGVDWQRPLLELGLAGLVAAAVYLLIAKEAGPHFSVPKPHLPAALRKLTRTHACFIALREFAGVGTMSLSALYLAKGLGYSPQKAGGILGLSLLFAAIVNPITVYLTGGKRRMAAHLIVLAVGAPAIASLPFWRAAAAPVVLIVAQSLTLVSSAITDAALTERIPPAFRGRVNGIFLTIVGTTAACSPFVVTSIIDLLGSRALAPGGFTLPYAGLAVFMLAAGGSLHTFRRIADFTQPDLAHAPAVPNPSPLLASPVLAGGGTLPLP